MNVPTRTWLDALLVAAGGNDSLLGNSSLGLIAAPFTPGPGLVMADITEANFQGYVRKSLGNPTIPFTGSDGLQYVQGTTAQWIPTGSDSPNTIYGGFITNGVDTTTLQLSDALDAPKALATPLDSLTITPRVGANPAGNWGLNVISS